MKKVLSIVIVIALLATQFILPAFAEEIEITVENVTVTATRDLIDRYDGSWDVEYDEEENKTKFFVYDTTAAEFWFELEMSDGETFSGDMWEVSGYLDTEFFYDNIVCYDENHIGTYKVEVGCEYFTAEAEVNVVENPVESVRVEATETLIENWTGDWEEYWEDEDSVEFFYYDTYYAFPYYTITYKDGTVYEGFDDAISDQTGYYPYDIDTQYGNPCVVGKNTAKASFLGVECEYEVEVVETPVASIEAVPTFPLYENYNGYWAEKLTEDGTEEYFEYSVVDSLPVFTVTFKDGEVVEGTTEEIWFLTGEDFVIVNDQYDNHWTLGENTAKFVYMGCEVSFPVEVVKDTVVSVTGEPMTYLIEKYSGFWENNVDEEGNETKYFWYDVYEAEPMFTITYEDGSTFTGTDEEIYWKTGVWTYDYTEQFANPWVVGENTANMSYLGHEFEVVFEVQESPVESVVLTEENGLTIEIKYKDDETASKAKAIDVVSEYVGFYEKTYIVTTNGEIECTIYTNADEDSGAIYSKDDLKIKGKGNLTVNGNCADGIVGKDSVKIFNGNINVNAVDDGIRGKDSVKIGDADDTDFSALNVTVVSSGGDGITSTNDTDADKGNVIINGGTIRTFPRPMQLRIPLNRFLGFKFKTQLFNFRHL